MALLAAVVALANLPAGFQNAQLRRSVAALLSLSLEEYTRARMTYDLGRLAGHTLIAREPGTHRYRPTAKGLAIESTSTGDATGSTTFKARAARRKEIPTTR